MNFSVSLAICRCLFSAAKTLQHRLVAFQARLNARKRRKARTCFTNQQIFELERRFVYQKYLSPADRDEIAHSLGISGAQVITWFQNRRAKFRRDLEEMKSDVQAAKIMDNKQINKLCKRLEIWLLRFSRQVLKSHNWKSSSYRLFSTFTQHGSAAFEVSMLLQCPFRTRWSTNSQPSKNDSRNARKLDCREVNVLEYSLSALKQLVVSEPLGFIVKVVEQCLCFYLVFIEFVEQISF